MWKRLSFVWVALLAAAMACSFNFSTASIEDAWMSTDEGGEQRVSVYAPDAVFYAQVDLQNAPDDTELKGIWYADKAAGVEPGTVLYETSTTSGSGLITFHLANEMLWPAGTYRFEVYLNGELAQTLYFEVQGETVEQPPAATPAAAGGNDPTAGWGVAFSDDFSLTTSGWDIADWENGATGYTADGRYEVIVRSPNYDIWGNPGLFFSDARIEVDFTKDSGTEINDIGLICRYQETDSAFSFYYLVVGSDGYAGAYKVVNGESAVLQELQSGSLQVNPQGQVNHLRLDCIGDRLTLFLNGQKVFQVSDSDLTEGDVGLVAGVFDEPNLRVLFDNFVVYTP